MRRLFVALSLLAGMVFSTPSVRAAGYQHAHQQLFHNVQLHDLQRILSAPMPGRFRSNTAVGAPAKQVQSGFIKNAGQLNENISWPSGFSVTSGTMTPAVADDQTQTDLGFIHWEFDQGTGFHLSYKDIGMLFGYAEDGIEALPDGTGYNVEYIGSGYSSPDAATNAFTSLANYFAALGAYIPGTIASTCSFSGAEQCFQVTIQGAFTRANGVVYNGKIRILQKSNAVLEAGYFMAQQDWSQNQANNDQNMDVLSKGFIDLFNPTPSPSPSPSPSPAPSPKPSPKPSPSPSPSPSPGPSAPPTTQTHLTFIKVQFEKRGAACSVDDAALKKAKVHSKARVVGYFTLDSGPSSVTVTTTFTITRGTPAGNSVSRSTLSGSLSPDPNSVICAHFNITLPKKTGTYYVTMLISAGGESHQSTARIKIVKK